MSVPSCRLPVALLVCTLVAAPAGWIAVGGVSAQALERDLFVSVLGPTGEPATDLTVSEFIVREDGVQREVLRAVPATDPLQIALLVDNSQAASRDVADIRDGLRAFINGLTIDYEMAVVTVGDRPTIVADYTTDTKRLLDVVGRVFPMPGSGAYVLEALIDVSRGMRRREPARPVIVVFATEGPELSEYHEDRVLEAVSETGAPLHVVMITDTQADLISELVRARNAVFDRGTRATGGRKDFVLTSQALPARLGSLAAELSNQYRVTYARPEALIPPKEVRVSVTRERYEARGTPVKGTGGGR